MAESSLGAADGLRGLGDVPYAFGEAAARDEVLVGLGPQGLSWEPLAAREFLARVAALAKGLIGVGIGAGDRVAVVARPGVECALVVYAAWVVRAVVVVVPPQVGAGRLDFVLRDCDPAAVVLEDGRHGRVVGAVGRELSQLARVWRLDEGGLEAIERPGAYMDSTAVRFRREEQSPADWAAIVYPVSTVVGARGVVLTHGGVLGSAEAVVERFGAQAAGRASEPAGRVLVGLGLWEAGGLVALVACALVRAPVGFCRPDPGVRRQVRTFGARVLVCGPWLVERVYAAEKAATRQNGWDNVDAFNVAAELAVEYDKAPRKGPWRRVSRAMYEWVFSRVREALGGRVQVVVCAGGGLPARLEHFFNGAGVPLVQAWGTPESGGVVVAGEPGRRRAGTVGRALAGVSVRASGDGEVYVRGPGSFAAYWGDERASGAAVWEGWLATGWSGSLDEEGFVLLGGRLRVQAGWSGGGGRVGARAAGGGVAEPVPEAGDYAGVWEQRACGHPLVSQAMVIGRGRPYAAALVTLAGDQAEYWRLVNNRPLSMSREELAADADLGAEIRSAVVAANQAVPAAWAVRAFHVLAEEFTAAGGLVLADGSLRRDAVLRAFAEEIEGLYAGREAPEGR